MLRLIENFMISMFGYIMNTLGCFSIKNDVKHSGQTTLNCASALVAYTTPSVCIYATPSIYILARVPLMVHACGSCVSLSG